MIVEKGKKRLTTYFPLKIEHPMIICEYGEYESAKREWTLEIEWFKMEKIMREKRFFY